VSKRKKKQSKFQFMVSPWVKDMETWCQGRMWMPRAALLLLFAYIGWQHLANPEYQDIFKGLNLGIHELGHYVFAPGGEFLHVAGGTLFQCLVPIGSMFMFLRQRDYFAIAVAWGWLATNFYDVAVYAADARSMALPLVSPGAPGGDIIHDWNFMLENLGWLRFDHVIGQFIRLEATICMMICLGFGAWLCMAMYQFKEQSKLQPEERM
jgi:hypothetical protein